MNDRIAFLEISSYGKHYFGKIRFGDAHIECTKLVSQKDAERFNQFDRWQSYKVGMVTTRLASESEVIEIAISIWKERFPDALILVRGRKYIAEPQFALAGPQILVNELNILYNEAEKIGWWDRDGGAMWEVEDKWYALLRGEG